MSDRPWIVPAPARGRDLPPPPGVTRTGDGIEASVYAGHADRVDLCLFDQTGGGERRVPLIERAHGWWFGAVPDVGLSQRYGFRADGPWDPGQGLRYNPHKLLLDPYARAIDGEITWGPAVYGHAVGDDWTGDTGIRSDLDSAAAMPKGVIVDDRFDWGDDSFPRTPRHDSVIYELHVKGFTATHPGIPQHLRGTYAGLAHPTAIAHLHDLGVTAVELLPMHTFTTEPEVRRRGLPNYWGYNTLGYFAPNASYAAATDPQGVLDEFKGMVKLLHAAGIEVILDVVYNHTAEQSQRGATLSWRGLDNRAYYRLDDRGDDVDVTGCGNTLDLRHPVTCRMVLDSLRYWHTECHVDGFRFDLAVTLARGRSDEYDPDHPFLIALRTDPVLSGVKLIAEPWDLGMHGWRTGQFPPPMSEWNDRFRDRARTFWLPDVASRLGGGTGHGVQDLATRLAGSQDLFGARDRGPVASVNFVVAHDGFTLADLAAYNGKHNGANGEDNRDGSDNNDSWNHGVEGPTDDPTIQATRRRTMRNLLATLAISAGMPMLAAGDEVGRTQGGNNNAYCQDNETSWIDWDREPWQEDLRATTAWLFTQRQRHPALRRRNFYTGQNSPTDQRPDVDWYGPDGQPMGDAWGDSSVDTLQMFVDGTPYPLLLVLHGGVHDTRITLPTVPEVTGYALAWDSTWERPMEPDGIEPATNPPGPVDIGPTSVRFYRGITG